MIRPGFALSRLVWPCRGCHCWVENRRSLAQGLGLLVRRGVNPVFEGPGVTSWPVVLLTDDGWALRPDGVRA